MSPLGPGAPRSPCEEGEMLQRCPAGSRQHLSGHPNTWRCIILSPAPHPTESLTLSPRSPRFPGTPCGGEERYGQEGAWIRVQLRKEGTYCWPTIPFWPWAPIFTLQEGRDARRVFSLEAPQHHPTPGTAAALAQRPARAGTISLTVPSYEDIVGTMAVPTRGPGSPRSPLAPGSPAPRAPCQRKARTCSHPHCPQLLPVLLRNPLPPCRGHPTVPTTSLGAWHTGGCHVPPSRVGSEPSEVRWLQGHSTREAASHLSCYRAAPGPTLSPFSPGAPCMP